MELPFNKSTGDLDVYLLLKRSLDVIGATLGLIVSVPCFALVIPAMLILDGRPILFTQDRAGKRGKVFRLYKLRTLQPDADPLNPSDHVTRTGRFLRRFGLDELPQLFNILRGEMSFVGPRPILLAEANNYNDSQRRRLEVLPGLTGWAQVNGRNKLEWHERIEKDLWYVDNKSMLLDLRILLKTPAAVLNTSGVYGPGNLDPDADDLRRLDQIKSSA